jgi:hypothetical protein
LALDGRALALGYRLGSDTLLVLLDLAVRATDNEEGVMVAVSYRDMARRLGVSKDTIGRRIRMLCQAGVVVEREAQHCDQFAPPTYELRLELAGVTREAKTEAA